MITLTTVNWMHEADLLCAHLASHGIEADIPDEGTMTVLPLHGSALGGIRIQVHEKDLEAASALLRTFIAASAPPVLCPVCRSADTSSKRQSWFLAAGIVLLLGIPLLWLRRTFCCRACGHVWKERNPETTEA